MSTNITNQVSFLRTTRSFPEELHQLTVEVDKAYVDTANAVNARTIGLYALNRPSITGESFFLSGNQRQQTLRQVYTFTTTSSINHNVQVISTNSFTSATGSYTNGTSCFGLIFGTSGAIPNQISFYLTSTQIVFVVDGGAPALTSGRIVLTWLSSP